MYIAFLPVSEASIADKIHAMLRQSRKIALWPDLAQDCNELVVDSALDLSTYRQASASCTTTEFRLNVTKTFKDLKPCTHTSQVPARMQMVLVQS